VILSSCDFLGVYDDARTKRTASSGIVPLAEKLGWIRFPSSGGLSFWVLVSGHGAKARSRGSDEVELRLSDAVVVHVGGVCCEDSMTGISEGR
jgi:hypothetical protein